MPYYPKSQVKTNLYTSDGTFSLNSPNQSPNQTPYLGYYYKTSNGEIFAGKTPNINPPQKLYPVFILSYNESFSYNNYPPQFSTTNQDVIIQKTFEAQTAQYDSIPGSNFTNARLLPTTNPEHPTKQDIQNGYFTRYFCKKNNELKYIEIDKTMFTKLQNQDSQVAWDLYTPTSVQWIIKGDLTNVASTNSTNVNVASRNSNFNGFSQFFKSYTQYYVEPNNNPTNLSLNTSTSPILPPSPLINNTPRLI